VFQLLLLVWAVRRAGMKLHVPRPRLTPQMRLLLRRMGPSLIGAGVTQLNLAVDGIIGSLLAPGTVSILYFADRVNQLPLGTIGVAVGTALLPTLSRQALSGEAEAAINTLNRALEYALTLTLPAAFALLAIPGPIIGVLFERGAFDAHSVTLSAQALAAYAVGLPAFVLVRVLVPGFFARGDTAMPVKVGTAVVGLNLALNVAFMVPLQHLGPPLASSLAAWCNVAALAIILRRRGHLSIDSGLRRVVPRTFVAGLVMVAVLIALRHGVYAPLAAAGGLRWLALATLIAGGLAAYGIAGQALGAFDIRAMTGVARRKNLHL
jgi:putative peptidoglycan lipid II flippase